MTTPSIHILRQTQPWDSPFWPNLFVFWTFHPQITTCLAC